MKKIFLALFIPFFVLAALSESEKIERLFQAIEQSDVIFIRNGAEYSAKEATVHLREKLKSAENSFFAPAKKDWTAKMFIEKVASKSSLSGKDYYVKLKDGQIMTSRFWLMQKLAEIEKSN